MNVCIAMKKLLPPLILFLIGIIFCFSDRTDNNFSGVTSPTETKADKTSPIDTTESRDSITVNPLATWETDYGLLTLKGNLSNKSVTGFYYDDSNGLEGKIKARYVQKVLTGYWLQTNSEKKCSHKKFGTNYWGKITFQFTGKSFIGKWSYCDDKPFLSWNGRLKGLT